MSGPQVKPKDMLTREGEVVKARSLADGQYIGTDSEGSQHIFFHDPTDVAEKAALRKRQLSRGKMRQIARKPGGWHQIASIPAVAFFAYGRRTEDPDFVKSLLKKHPEWRTYEEGSTPSTRIKQVPIEASKQEKEA